MISAPPIMFFALLTVLAIFLNNFARRTMVVVNQIALDVGVVLFCISLMGGLQVMSDPTALEPIFWWRTVRILLRPDDKVDH